MIWAWAAAAGGASVAANAYQHGTRLSTDGLVYLRAASGQRVHAPFHLRWLVPFAMPPRFGAWVALGLVSLVASAVLIAWYAQIQGVPAPMTVVGLWVTCSLYRVTAFFPALVDGPALAVALLSACLALRRMPLYAAAAGILCGLISEKAGLFAAAWSQSPWPLACVPATAAIAALRRPQTGSDDEGVWPWGQLARVRQKRSGRVNSITALALPWGAGLAAALGGWAPVDLVALALAYGQLLIGMDCVRLYQWSAPLVLCKTAHVLPPRWHAAAVLFGWVNPWGGVRL